MENDNVSIILHQRNLAAGLAFPYSGSVVLAEKRQYKQWIHAEALTESNGMTRMEQQTRELKVPPDQL